MDEEEVAAAASTAADKDGDHEESESADDDDYSEEEEEIEMLATHLPKRASRGTRIRELMDAEQEADGAFWDQNAWADGSEDDSYEHVSEKDSEDADIDHAEVGRRWVVVVVSCACPPPPPSMSRFSTHTRATPNNVGGGRYRCRTANTATRAWASNSVCQSGATITSTPRFGTKSD